MFLEDLFEARKNPELNPKISAYEHLEEYKANPKAYIRFTDDLKLGINPLHKDSTPAGIFAYPLKLSWSVYDVDNNKSFKKFPYGASRPYINLFEYTGNIIDVSKYKNFENDYKILFDKYSHIINMPKFLEILSKKLYQPSDFELLYRLSEMIAKELNPNQYQQSWNTVLRVLGYNAFLDTGKSLIHSGEPLQALILSIKDIKPIDTFLNKDYKHTKIQTLSINTPDELKNLIDNKHINIKNIIKSLSEPLLDYFQKYLENKNNDGTLLSFLEHRNMTDTKLLLLLWLNNHIYFNAVDKSLVVMIQQYFNGKNPTYIIKYAHNMVGTIWNDSVLQHNLELFKTV